MDSKEQMRIFGQRLRALRHAAKLTQAQLAEKTDISCVYVNKLERGLAVPSIHVLCRLAKSLQAEVSSLFTEKDAVANSQEQSQGPSPYMALFLAANGARTRRLVFETDEEPIALPPYTTRGK
jgi:transcriptional regulator with XRE-family HTH domain